MGNYIEISFKLKKENCSKKVACGRRVAGAIRSLVNAREFQPECPEVLHETLLVPVLIYVE